MITTLIAKVLLAGRLLFARLNYHSLVKILSHTLSPLILFIALLELRLKQFLVVAVCHLVRCLTVYD